MQCAVSAGLTVGVLTALLTGCQHNAATYEPQLTMESLAVDVATPDNAYVLQLEQQTQGRFPCSLVVAKLAPPGRDPAERLTLVELSPGEQAHWTEAFRGLSAIRDLLFLTPRSLVPQPDGIDSVLAAARRVEAPLVLLHVANRFGPNSAQVLGLLYDVELARPLATLHASARYTDDDGDEEPMDRKRGDHRETDARFQAARAFELYAVDCLRDQIRRDSPPPSTMPHRWTPFPHCVPLLPALPPPASQPAGMSGWQLLIPRATQANAPIRAAAPGLEPPP